ncbi:MAG: DNA recombination protein RmuC, partial [Candidatus Omnitrophota bacterium]
APKLRGNYGETVLEEMLERILPNKAMWERQYPIEGGEKVDAVVKYKDVVVPIDSKFPKEDYQKYISAREAGEKKEHWANYEKALKTQINSIKEKYVKPEKGTTEFALLFIPSESIYYETIAEKNYLGDPCQIYEYATDRRVIPVSPNTFYAFLQVVMLGIRNIEIAKEARKLQESLSRVEKDFGLFYKKFELIGKSLESASKAYETGEGHVQRFKKNLDSTLKLDEHFQIEVEGESFIEDKTEGA